MNITDISIGVDMELISRFKDLDRKTNGKFLNKIFAKKEIDYCFSKPAPAQHLAVRFAAKEAIVKAISSLGKRILSLNKIEIVRNANGSPRVKINSTDFQDLQIYVSLSHCKDIAIAFTIVMKSDLFK